MIDKRILPQANNLDTVVRVFLYCSIMDECTIGDIAGFCNFDPRQASYYLNACCYLGLVDQKGVLTPIGENIIKNYQTPQLGVYERIISDEVIGKIFAHMVLFPHEDIADFAVNYLTPLYPEYGSAVIKRRASTLKSWCEDIIRYLKNNFK